jgi:hypothetical protein
MPANYVLLEKITVGAAGATFVKFSSIPQTGYTDLVLKGSTRTTRAAVTDYCYIYPNGSADMSGMRIGGDGSSVGSSGGATSAYTTFAIPGANSTANTFGNFEIYFTNYNSTTTYKSFSEDIVAENNATLAESGFNAILYKSNTAISSIEIYPSVGPFAQYSTFYLYGVAKLGTTPAIVPYATGGDTIMTDGTYWYHAFKANGTFTPAKALSCDVLVIAGGGSSGASTGGNYTSGGGGAGGYLKYASQSLTATNYTVTIGGGGTGASVGTNNGNQGSNSQFASLTASVGGGFGGANGAGNGGSGGGSSVGNATGGTATSGQGFAGGGGGPGAANYTGGGGGGAGAVGAAGTSSNGGAGGAGTNADSSWLTATGTGVSGFIAGGGGGASWGAGLGGAGGSGGGGLGGGNSTQNAGVAATANTGSGGGGGGNGYAGASGGSGLVIVRYAV